MKLVAVLGTPSPKTHRLTNHPGGGSPPRLTVKRPYVVVKVCVTLAPGARSSVVRAADS